MDESDLRRRRRRPDSASLEAEVAELRGSLARMTATVDKIYNVVKIIYWDGQRAAPPPPPQSRPAPQGLLRQVLTRSHLKAATTRDPPSRRGRHRGCRVAFDLLGPSAAAAAPPVRPRADRRSSGYVDDSTLRWAELLPRLLDGPSRFEGEEYFTGCRQPRPPRDAPEDVLQPIVEGDHEFPTGIPVVVVVGPDVTPDQASSVDPLGPAVRHSPRVSETAKMHVPSSRPVPVSSSAGFSGGTADGSELQDLSGGCSPSPGETKWTSSLDPTPGSTAQDSRATGLVAGAAGVAKTCSKGGSCLVLVHCQGLLERMLKCGCASDDSANQQPASTSTDGTSTDGTSTDGTSTEGTSTEGTSTEGTSTEGTP
ncbi:uncharacterized protein LOC134535953 [Bacillus rossius redtenbacheri]|uniref:uncharacterized protein LOC134535953 n=1 Tax=Bacillus rossius redtenbacheri TaxID=93214 RepID=UPI002FDDEE01